MRCEPLPFPPGDGPFRGRGIIFKGYTDYIDARTRREGWDIQVRFNAIAQRERQERARSLAA